MRHEHGAMCRANLEEMKLKASYVDADCIKDMDKQIGQLAASIIRDLRKARGI
jgi:hypothetical protein